MADQDQQSDQPLLGSRPAPAGGGGTFVPASEGRVLRRDWFGLFLMGTINNLVYVII